MESIEKFLFGYRVVSFDEGDSEYFANVLLRSGISAVIRRGKVSIPLSKYKRFTKFAAGKEFTASLPRGIGAYLLSLRERVALLISIALATLALILLSDVVWDVRLDADPSVSEEYLLEALSECGLEVGRSFRSLDISEIENKCLILCEDIAWVNVNRRGTVAYVKVIRKSDTAIPQGNLPYSNIVAESDGVITSIDVTRGVALVKVGDVVRRGDVLISGILGSGDNVSFCNAKGTVSATVNATLTTFAPREAEICVYTEEYIISKVLKIFDFAINILKNYRNLDSECDIIENEVVYSLPNGVRLPIKIYEERARYREYRLYHYSESELTECASYALSRQLDELIDGGELISLRSKGEFHTDGYTVITEVSYVRDIGVCSPLSD